MATIAKTSSSSFSLTPIQRVALGTKFQELGGLEEIISATPNPEVAIELLLGIYVDPQINEVPAEFNMNHQNIEFVSYDKFRLEMTYRYQYAATKWYWFAKDVTEFVPANAVAEGSYSIDAVAKYNKDNDCNLSLEEFKQLFVCKCIVVSVSDEVKTACISLSHWNGDK
jgi:hypothetical protein